jgi:glycosyltransferase involved in cell wall biosynthesis
VTELLGGLAELGHQIDCFLPGTPRSIPERLSSQQNLEFISGTNKWRWDRWYSRTKITSFASGLIARAVGSLRLRREIVRRHKQHPYDLIFQNQTIESLGVPASIARSIPLVIRPDTHQAGELRWLIAERRLAFSCQPRRVFFLVATIMALRSLAQAVQIRRASLLICISSVFRDHIVHDYRFPMEKTVVIANPVRLDRFTRSDRPLGQPPVVLVPTRLSLRKGLEDVVEIARALPPRGLDARVRVVGGPSMWSDYSKLLQRLPEESAEYGGRIPPREMPGELQRSDVVLVTSKYEPFGLTVAEALASGVPVIASSEVGAIEHVERHVASVVAPGDVSGFVDAIAEQLERLSRTADEIHTRARSEAERLFSPALICGQISEALEQLVEQHSHS